MLRIYQVCVTPCVMGVSFWDEANSFQGTKEKGATQKEGVAPRSQETKILQDLRDRLNPTHPAGTPVFFFFKNNPFVFHCLFDWDLS